MDNNFSVNFTPTTSPVSGQRARYDQLQGNLTGAIGNQERVPQLAQRYNEQYGVPQLQSNLQGAQESFDYLGNQIRSLPKGVDQSSQESVLTQGQRDRIVQSRQAPLIEAQGQVGQQIGQLGSRLSTAQSNVSNMISAEQMQQEKELMPFLKAYDNEAILGSMEMTGWSFQNQAELSRLLANQQAGITLSEGEKNRLNALAVSEQSFQNALKLNSQQNNFTRENYQLQNPDPLGLGL